MANSILDGTKGLTLPDGSNMASIMRSYLAGLTLSTAGSSATFGIAAGQAVDSTNVQLMQLTSAYTKTTSSWAVGTGNGGIDVGIVANSTWYHVYLMMRPDTGVVDLCFSTSASAPNTSSGFIPAAYTLYRRIGSMKTNGSAQWTLFTQTGDQFQWSVSVQDVNFTTLSTTPVTCPLTVPTGAKVNALFRGYCYSTSVPIDVVFWSPDQATQVANTPGGNFSLASAAANIGAAGQFSILTDTSANIIVVSDTANTHLQIVTYGWIDRRGRDS